jgi:hypothetical protein
VSHKPSVIDGGRAVAGRIVLSKTILQVTGGKADAPETSLEDLMAARETSGVQEVELGGAEADGAVLHLNGKTHA